MFDENIIVGLDIGTSKIAIVIGKIRPHDQIEVIGTGITPSTGLRRGKFVDLKITTSQVKQAVHQVAKAAGVEVTAVYAGIATAYTKGDNYHGYVQLSRRANRCITSSDVQRAIEKAASDAVPVPTESVVLSVFPQGYIVDNQPNIANPVGMSGQTLGAIAHVITCEWASIQNIVRAINEAGLQVEHVELQPIASGQAVLQHEEKELGVVLLDIGAGTTDVALYTNGVIRHTAVIPIGGDQVTNDISVGVHIPPANAETLKITSGCALMQSGSSREKIEIVGTDGFYHRSVSGYFLQYVIEARMREILELAYKTISSNGYMYRRDFAAGVVVTGGTSLLKGVPKLTEQVFDIPARTVRIGSPSLVSSLEYPLNGEGPIYATAVGLMLLGVEARLANRNTTQPIKSRWLASLVKCYRKVIRGRTGISPASEWVEEPVVQTPPPLDLHHDQSGFPIVTGDGIRQGRVRRGE